MATATASGVGFPTGYTSWKKANSETIVREEEKIAREVYIKVVDGLGAGTIVVKEQYAWADGAKGALQSYVDTEPNAPDASQMKALIKALG